MEETIEKTVNWTTWRAETFEKIRQLIEGRNCSKFHITGYKHLEMTLVLEYDDATETFVFNPMGEDTFVHTDKPGWN